MHLASVLPPGPELPSLAQTIAFHRDPLGVLRRSRARFGPVFTLQLAVAGPMVVVAERAGISAVVEADPVRGHAGEGRRRVVPLASPRSVFGADGERHRFARQALEAAFTREAVARRGDEMARIAEPHVRRWPSERPFRVLPRMRALVDEIFVRSILGVRNDERAACLTAAIGRMLWTPGNPPVPTPGEGNGPLGLAATAFFERRRAPVARLLADEISARRRLDDPHDDVVGCLVRAEPTQSPDALADELTAVLMAGQEPPAAALTWLLERLGQSPELAERFAAPDPGPDGAAVVAETLRLRPAAIAAIRRLTSPLTVAGHELLPGIVAMVPIPLVHRDATAFPQPDRFLPERWITRPPDESTYLPFGGGARRCLGEHLARAYIDTLLPIIVSARRVRPAWPRRERMVLRGTILVPHRGGLMVAEPRAGSAYPPAR